MTNLKCGKLAVNNKINRKCNYGNLNPKTKIKVIYIDLQGDSVTYCWLYELMRYFMNAQKVALMIHFYDVSLCDW